jgi:DMSO/TMAO reductase YedYZ molybdopterin-dependent catalytic subunit
MQEMSRRSLLKGGGAALAGLTTLQATAPALATQGRHGGEVIPWADQPPPFPDPPPVWVLPTWEELDTWVTPNEKFFTVYHYGIPQIDGASWRLDISGLVKRTQSLGLADLQARRRRDQTVTLECSGNHGFPFFTGATGNARWTGTPLAPLLERAGLDEKASEVVFYGADAGELTIRDNPGILEPGMTGKVTPDEAGGLDLTITEPFSRSMSVAEALDPRNLLAFGMNGAPLPPVHGYPVRLIAPGWYGVANVKWLTRIEVVAQRHAGRFMARDYVTIREEQRGGNTLWTFSNVNRMRLKSAPGRVRRKRDRYMIEGAAWGAAIAEVEVRIDDGPWLEARLERHEREGFAWVFWALPWHRPQRGEHAITSRAYDYAGNLQPEPDDPYLASRVTYWEANGQITRRVRIP